MTVKNAAGIGRVLCFERKGPVSAERAAAIWREMVQQHGAAMVSDGVMPPNAAYGRNASNFARAN